MSLTQSQIAQFHKDGFLVVPGVFSSYEVAALRRACERDLQNDGPFVVREQHEQAIRAIYACHTRQDEFARLIREERTLGSAKQLIDCDLYLYQFKIHMKPALSGEAWSWHRDYAVWGYVDKLSAPSLVSVAIFLDEINEFNGPVVFIPGSHHCQLKARRPATREAGHAETTAYSPSSDDLARMVNDLGMVAAKGPAGTALFISPMVVHGSSTNIAPFPRKLAISTYNDVRNAPASAGKRADYVVCPPTPPLQVDAVRFADIHRQLDLPA